ncbi:MAG: aminoacyl-tRNA hydrolase, partial [Actinomycetota bacterium]|nr:aminoacyl-tRNA hydrolase [Actinomycetota bacterium]
TQDFIRVRVGISRPSGPQDPADYVLSDFSPPQRKDLEDVIDRAADAVEAVVREGAERAMNDINTRP